MSLDVMTFEFRSVICVLYLIHLCMFCYVQAHSACLFYQEKSCFVTYILLQIIILYEFSSVWPFSAGGDHSHAKKLMKVSMLVAREV